MRPATVTPLYRDSRRTSRAHTSMTVDGYDSLYRIVLFTVGYVRSDSRRA